MAEDQQWPESTATWTKKEYEEDSLDLDESFNGEGPDHYTNYPDN